MLSPNASQNLANDDERIEGDLVDDSGGEDLSLPLSDEQIHALTNRIEKDKNWWNEELDLDNVRDRNEKFYLNIYSEQDLYDYEEEYEYKNNRIFTAVETLISVVLSQKAEPTVMPADEKDVSYQNAQDLESALLAIYEDEYLKQKAALIARHLLIGLRVGVLRLRFDPERGEKNPDGSRRGAIVLEVRRPQQIVIGRGTKDPDNIPFIADFDEDTIENLVAKFPKKKDEIFKKFGIKRGVTSQLQKRVGYVTCFFDYRDQKGELQNAVCWKIDELVLDAYKNPNYNYDEWDNSDPESPKRLNFFDRPKAPYILFNHLNLGKYVIDSTSLSEQAQPMQKILNKRGRQIVENADQAQSGLVLNESQINSDDASKLTGDPREKIMVEGDVRTAAARLPRNKLEAFVLRDKQDARDEIDNIFGANAAVRGEDTDAKTLGQDVMSQRANMGRIQVLADSIEDGFDRAYKYVAQMIKVYFDEDVSMSYEGAEGLAKFVEMNQDKVDPRQKVRVKAGSMIPKDKWAQRNETIQSLSILDPLSIAEGLDKPNPREWAKRLVYYRFAMDKYLTDILRVDQTGTNQNAIADIQTILQTGTLPSMPNDPTQDYLMTLEAFITSDGFQNVPVQSQQLVISFTQAVIDKVKSMMGEGTPPPQEANQPTQPGMAPQQEQPVIQPEESVTGL